MQDTSRLGLSAVILCQTVAADDDARQSDDDIRSEIDARQDEVLKQLDELNARIEAMIRQFAPPSPRDDRLAAA